MLQRIWGVCALVCGEISTVKCVMLSDLANISVFVCVVQVQGFFSSLKERGSQMRSVQEALETIRLNQRWMDENLATLKRWL